MGTPEYSVVYDSTDFYIKDSYKYHSLKDMIVIVTDIKRRFPDKFAKRSVFSLINEWRSHNLLYTVGYQRVHTAETNFNYEMPWYMNVVYAIMSLFYLHFV